MVNSNVTTIALDGNETVIEFKNGYPYYFITNKGDADIYASMSPNITPEAEGVYTVPAGGTERIGAGYSLPKFYILGTGKVQIRGEQIAVLPSFKRGGKGGDTDEQILLNMPLTTDLSDISGFDRVAEYSGNTPLTIDENGVYLYYGYVKIYTEFLNDISDFTVEFDIKINSEGTYNYPFYRRVLTIQYLNLGVSYASYVTTNKFKFEMFNNLSSENARSTYYTYADNHYHHVVIDYHIQDMCALGCVDNKDPFCIKYFAEQKGNIFLGDEIYGLNGYIKNFVIKTRR